MRRVYSTGQVARICQVAPRTVSKWFDSGTLKGFRIPGSQDRRIPHERLVEFLVANGMTELVSDLIMRDRVTLVGLSDHLESIVRDHVGNRTEVQSISNLFQAGVELASPPSVAVIDRNTVDYTSAMRIVDYLIARDVQVIVLIREDSHPDEWELVSRVQALQHPVDTIKLRRRLDNALDKRLPGGSPRSNNITPLMVTEEPLSPDTQIPSIEGLPNAS